MDTVDIRKQKTIEEIQKMTDSVKMLSEKQIGRTDEQLVQQQLAFETTQERRRNFMEGRGMTVSPAFIRARARVLNHEPVLKRGDTKSQREQDEKVTEMFQKRFGEFRQEEQGLRDVFAQEDETAFIKARSFATPYQYESLVKAKQWMTGNPERYAANREAVDAIYRDLYAASEVYGTYTTKGKTYESIRLDLEDQMRARKISREEGRNMQLEVERRSDIENERKTLIEHRIGILMDSLGMLLRGREADGAVREFARAYMPADNAQAMHEVQRYAGHARSREDACRAGFLPVVQEVLRDTYEDRAPEEINRLAEQIISEDAANLYLSYREGEEEWNRKLAGKLVAEKVDTTASSRSMVENIVKEVVDRYYDTAMVNINVEDLFSMSDDQLMQNADMFEECGMTGEVVRSMENEQIRYTLGRGSSYRERYRGTRRLGSDAIFLRSALIGQYAKKARMLWYVEAYKMGILNADLVSRQDMGAGIDGGSPQALLAGVKKELANCNAQIKALRKSYGQA